MAGAFCTRLSFLDYLITKLVVLDNAKATKEKNIFDESAKKI